MISRSLPRRCPVWELSMFSSYNFNPFTVCFQFMEDNYNLFGRLKMSYSAVRLYLAPPSRVTSGCKKPRWRRPKCRTRGFKTAVHKPMCDITVTTSTSYIQSMEISQHLPHGFAQNLLQPFVVPRGWMLPTLVIPWLFLQCHHGVGICRFDWNV